MDNFLEIALTRAVVGGVAASGLASLAAIGGVIGLQGSRIRRKRRLANDSDARLIAILFFLGAVLGVATSTVDWMAPKICEVLLAVVAFKLGLLVALRHCMGLNSRYLGRARQNLDAGNYNDAIEDASEVARSSEALRSVANQIIAEAREARIHGAFPDARPSYEGQAASGMPSPRWLQRQH